MPVWSDSEGLANPQRLNALESLGLPESAAPENFERIANLVRATLSAPVSLISMVHPEHQVHLSAAGLSEPWASWGETPLSHALCKYVVATDSILDISETRTNPLTADSCAATDVQVKAYLGAPLHHPDGHVLGTIYVLDDRPHAWTPSDREYLREYAELVDQELRNVHERRTKGRDAWRNAAGLFEYLNDAVIMVNSGGIVSQWNPAAADLLGFPREEAVGRPVAELLAREAAPGLLDEIANSLQQSGRWVGTIPVSCRDGSSLTLQTSAVALHDESGEGIGYVTINRDARVRERVDAAMIQAQKMEALGSLAGGLAHDFNNLLSAVLGSVSLLRMSETTYSADDTESLDTIEHAARRAADITGGLLSFARGELSRLAGVDLRTVVNDALRLARYSVPREVTVDLKISADPVIVEGDTSQLQQAVLNIMLNACYVLDKGGTITIEVSAVEGRGTIRVTDTGPGMDAGTVARIWEPFFTTKPHGLGTGLGLPSCYGIVASHRGTIEVASVPGEGSTFTIDIPLFDPAQSQEQTPLSLAPGAVVLVVDDDAIIRRATVSMLKRIGFRAEAAASGDEAIQRVREDPTRWAAILLDLVMPQKTGADTFRELWAIRPDLPVIISSGYAPDRFLEDDDRRRIASILHKPFTLERLRTTLEEVGLTAPGPSAA